MIAPPFTHAHYTLRMPPAYYPGGAMGTSRPTAMPHERGAHNGTAEQGTGGAHAI